MLEFLFAGGHVFFVSVFLWWAIYVGSGILFKPSLMGLLSEFGGFLAVGEFLCSLVLTTP